MVIFSQAALQEIESLEDEFARAAFNLFWNGQMPASKKVRDRRMIGWVGATQGMLARAWYLLEEQFDGVMPHGATQERFLWGLLLLKNYDTVENNASRCGGVDEKTFRKWAWWFLSELSYLETVVVWSFCHCCLCSDEYLFWCSVYLPLLLSFCFRLIGKIGRTMTFGMTA